MRLAEILRIYRFKHDLDLATLANQLGVSKSTVSRLENGKLPDWRTVIKLINWLFEEEKMKQ